MRDALWFEMRDIRRRRMADAVWIPLRAAETVVLEGAKGTPSLVEEILCVGSIAFTQEKRALAESLGWMDLGLFHTGGPYAFEDGRYKPCEVFQYNEREDDGIDLVFEQHLNRDHSRVWHLSQDLIIALGLLEEGDTWVRPDEGYAVVCRRRRDANGRVVAIEIRNEFLRDYLAARSLSLRVASYRQRTEISQGEPDLPWRTTGIREEAPNDRFEARVAECDERGGPHGAGVAVFRAWRTDVDEGADVPVMKSENDSNTDFESYSFRRGGSKYFRVDGELWREEWVEAAQQSLRVRGDATTETFAYIIDAAGHREVATNLNDEDIGRYLWFDPKVILALQAFRGAGLEWYSDETGSIWCSPDYHTHFGVNSLGLINIYAYDIAKLPPWQQRIWAGYNVAPDGQVSRELLAAQMRADPADTRAPERLLLDALQDLDDATLAWTGSRLLLHHHATEDVSSRVHRFKAIDRAGLLQLAKDLARLIVDRISIVGLRTIATPPEGQKWGSLKSLEKALATVVSEDEARRLMTPLVGVYELRLGDAHLPSSEINEAFAMVGLDPERNGVDQGKALIAAAANAVIAVRSALPV